VGKTARKIRPSAEPPVDTRERMLKPFGEKAHNFAYRHPKDDAPLNILHGSVRSAKTWATMVKIVLLTQYKIPGKKLIIGNSKQSVWNNVLSDLALLVGQKNFHYNRQSGELKLCGTDWLCVGASNEGSERYIRGITCGVAIVDEGVLVPESFMKMLMTRLSVAGARCYITTNPGSPQSYLKLTYLDDPEMYRSGFLWSQHFVLDDNPNLTDEYKEGLKRQFHGVFKLRYLDGLWVPAEGAIYGSLISEDIFFNEDNRPFGLYNAGGYQQRWLSIDYGTTNPFVALEWLDDGRIVWCIREWYFDSAAENCQKTDGEYADLLTTWLKQSPTGRGTENVEVIIDPSAASFKIEMMRRGFFVSDADNEVLDGIRQVSTMLGNRTLRIHEDRCPKTVVEHQGYSWNPTSRLRGVEEPMKVNDHTCDSARYLVRTKLNNPWRLALVA
jgi:PBSX family phage terminase large subunit